MDLLQEIDELLMSSSSSSEEEGISARPRQVVRRPYRVCRRSKVDDYDDVDFRKYFRLHKKAFWHLHGMVRSNIGGDPRRSRELTAEHKLLAVLRFLFCGNFEQTAADYIGISQPTMATILPLVCDAILQHFHTIVKMPQTEEERLAKAGAFAALAMFPRCIGAIDCTHIKINSPGGSISEAFRNCHGYFSLNVHTISDASLRILNVVARWPGSTHDSTILTNSVVHQQFESGQYGEYVIVGDGGYANSHYLCTPFTRHRNDALLTDAEKAYQRSIHTTRNVVERSYGVLKRRFPILRSGMQLNRLELIQKVIAVCCILHKICIDMGDINVDDLDMQADLPEQEGDVEAPPAPESAPPVTQTTVRRPFVRTQIVQIFAERIRQEIR